jgi:hypothetical protein
MDMDDGSCVMDWDMAIFDCGIPMASYDCLFDSDSEKNVEE